jgi:hypothetical protein
MGRVSHHGIEGKCGTGVMEQCSTRPENNVQHDQDKTENKTKNKQGTREQRLIEHCYSRIDNIHSSQLF